ncbi:MAG TPA: hypothetical protein VK762_26775, partial [Polyangiaceae bacterium]|nr:hypothetical protein [Polyangiaceae bacterium]
MADRARSSNPWAIASASGAPHVVSAADREAAPSGSRVLPARIAATHAAAIAATTRSSSGVRPP